MLITKFRNYGNGIGFEVYEILKSKTYSFYIKKCDVFSDKKGVRILQYIFNLGSRDNGYFKWDMLLRIEEFVGCITR